MYLLVRIAGVKILTCEYKAWVYTDVRVTRITQDAEVEGMRWKEESGVLKVVVNVCVFCSFQTSLEMKDVSLLTTPLLLLYLLLVSLFFIYFFQSLSPWLYIYSIHKLINSQIGNCFYYNIFGEVLMPAIEQGGSSEILLDLFQVFLSQKHSWH